MEDAASSRLMNVNANANHYYKPTQQDAELTSCHAVGCGFALWLTHQRAVIGVPMLMGIVTQELDPLLVDHVSLARRERGMGRLDAVIDACHRRARPIVMTMRPDVKRRLARHYYSPR